jgi:hypothetical protein
VVGYGPFSLCVIHKEGLCPSSGDINRLMMNTLYKVIVLETSVCFVLVPCDFCISHLKWIMSCLIDREFVYC